MSWSLSRGKIIYRTLKKTVPNPEVDLIVVRSLKNGEMSMAKPCSACLPVIKSYGVRYVYYSNFDGYISREVCAEMSTTHLCASHLAKMRKD